MPLAFGLLTQPTALERLLPDWNELAGKTGNELSTSPTWLGTWWKIFGDGRRLRVVTFRRDGKLLALVPLCFRRVWYRRALPFRRLELLGSGEDEADEICSDYIGPLIESGAEEEVVRAFVSALSAEQIGPWDELLMPAMNGSSPVPVLLASALARANFRSELIRSGDAPYIPLPASWDDYLRNLGSQHRYLITRSLRDWEKWSGQPPKLERSTTLDDLPRGQELLRTLHGERWKGDGTFRSPRFTAFHEQVMPALLSSGALELAWLSAHGRPMAVLYNIHWNDKVYFYQSGRQMDIPRHLRPGIVAHACAIRDAIAARRREYDFLNGTSQYKMQMALATRPIVTVRAGRSALLERARRAGEAIHRLRSRIVIE
jgi:hypothetical protein